jgi:ubiquinone/menaquinone biosynthesis C-methylase UbiE
VTKDSGWWDDFFPAFRPVFEIIPLKKTNEQVRYVVRKLKLTTGKKFLDCPCGIGRIALPMAKMGIKVTGVDFAQYYLDELAKKAKRRKLKIDLVCADMRRISLENKFDGAANIWTSFGFFEKESDNRLVLRKMYRALKPGGRFIMVLLNRDWAAHNFQPKGWFAAEGTMVCEESVFDYTSSTMRGIWHFVRDGEKVSRPMRLRVYSLHELIAMFRSIGFVEVEGFGSTNDEPVTRDCAHMWIIGRKPRAKR